jgi:ABC-type glutathione transport system ATPase component
VASRWPRPELVLLDKPPSAIDVPVQAQVPSLLRNLRDRLGLTYFFIAHDRAVVRYPCNRVAPINRGMSVEQGDSADVLDRPDSEYARMPIGAMPK